VSLFQVSYFSEHFAAAEIVEVVVLDFLSVEHYYGQHPSSAYSSEKKVTGNLKQFYYVLDELF